MTVQALERLTYLVHGHATPPATSGDPFQYLARIAVERVATEDGKWWVFVEALWKGAHEVDPPLPFGLDYRDSLFASPAEAARVMEERLTEYLNRG